MVKYRFGYKKYYIIRHNMRVAAILSFDKCLSPGQTTAINCKTAFSLHVVESAIATTTTSSSLCFKIYLLSC